MKFRITTTKWHFHSSHLGNLLPNIYSIHLHNLHTSVSQPSDGVVCIGVSPSTYPRMVWEGYGKWDNRDNNTWLRSAQPRPPRNHLGVGEKIQNKECTKRNTITQHIQQNQITTDHNRHRAWTVTHIGSETHSLVPSHRTSLNCLLPGLLNSQH